LRANNSKKVNLFLLFLNIFNCVCTVVIQHEFLGYCGFPKG
jgi:hypothetical protein